MSDMIYVLSGLASAFLGAVELAMLVRVVMSWFMPDEENRIMGFLCFLTEPFVLPFRKLFDKMDWFTDSPLDVPFFMTYLLLALLNVLLL